MSDAELCASTDKQLRVLSGMHRGASVALASAGTYTVGADETCAIVLCDRGIADKHCVICVDEFGITCRALEGKVYIDEELLAAGSVVAVDEFQPLACGPVTIGVGPAAGAERKWTQLQAKLQQGGAKPARTRFLKGNHAYVLSALLLSGAGGIASLAYATLGDSATSFPPSRVEAARSWLKAIAPPSSELFIGLAGEHTLLLSGYVPLAYQRDALTAAAQHSSFAPRIEVHAVDQMLASLTRLTQLDNLPCLPVYRSAGQVACSQQVDSELNAQRLRELAREVPGLTALDVSVRSAPKVAPAPAPPTVPSLTQKFSVLMFRNDRYLVGPYGERYREGDTFDGLKISQIALDEVVFEHEGRRYPFRVAALGARQ